MAPSASSRRCSIEGCEKQVAARGWCHAHWRRWRIHGSPLGGGPTPARPGEPLAYLRDHMRDGCCFPWPYSKDGNGRPKLWYDGALKSACCVACEEVHGPAPSREHEVAHGCGRGDLGCFNVDCLRWATKSENELDKLVHGTGPRGEQNPQNRLTSVNVVEIRCRLRSGETQASIASAFGVGQSTIADINTNRNWAWL